ncbi:MAG: tRNA (adenosine(37)-N6)-threonylcarbamoyltransferase complex ATPase subunit type 1 TsaE [Clostridia bacterium]|nr:tRNA (adenosine(37)-N6)-threonylcarbamoyltransferase complex ATPase subunit type 1 TsaE [Clostridia bacterium]
MSVERGADVKTYSTNSAEETKKVASEIASELVGGEVIAMKGDLGAGKTCFVSGLAAALGFLGEVTSPTFAIINEYLGGRLNVYHFDMYRVTSWEDLYSTGYFEYLEAGGVTAVEWSENIEAALPENYITVEILKNSDGGRIINVEGMK